MFTAIYALGYVVGAEVWLAGCIVCLLAAGSVSFAIPTNRGKGLLRTALCIALPAALCDLAWFFVYFPNGDYVNRGLASASGLLLYPLVLILSTVVVTAWNLARKEAQEE